MSCNKTLTSVTVIERYSGLVTQSNGVDVWIDGYHIVAAGINYYLSGGVSSSIKSGVLYLCDKCCTYTIKISDTPYTEAQLEAMFAAMWTTATRPTSPAIGQEGYNTTDNVREYWNGVIWIQY